MQHARKIKTVMCALYVSAIVCCIDVSSNGIIALAVATSVIRNLHTVMHTACINSLELGRRLGAAQQDVLIN